MSPQQEQLLHEAAKNSSEALSKLEDLHRTLYRNGFQARLKNVEDWIGKYPGGCVEQSAFLQHIEKHEKDLVDKTRWSIRKQDMLLVLIAALIAGLPAWVTLVFGG